MEEYCKFEQRKTTRLKNFDYSSNQYYFVTICCAKKKCIFGLPNQLNRLGMIARSEMEKLESHYSGVKVDNFVIMPNHIHAIICIADVSSADTLSSIVSSYKAGVSRKIRHERPCLDVWQRSFHDHIIRGQKDYEKIWHYITYNPLKWEEDCFFLSTSET